MPKGTGGESWLKQFRRLKQPLGLPRLDAGEYLLEAMFRLGPTCSNGLADVARDWPEIEAFARVTGRISEPSKCELLYDMCRGYHEAREAGKDPLAMPPAEAAKPKAA
ncbi:MAG TPA: hypothetical protein DEF16_00630 [Gemmobacter sp.]|nr:hypothetical protein [Gemmobacter sp.]